MLPLSHALSGFLVLFLLKTTGQVEVTTLNILLLVFVSVIPDIDGVWSKTVRDHHASLLHIPLTWILLSSIIMLKSFSLGLIVLTCSIFHLLADYLTALTTGVNLLYPFSQRDHHLCELTPEIGDFNPTSPSKDQLKSFFQLYWENKVVLIIESLIAFSGLVSIFLI